MNNFSKFVVFAIALFGLLVVFLFTPRPPDPRSQPVSSSSSTFGPTSVPYPSAAVECPAVILKQNWRTVGFDSIAMWRLLLHNPTNRTLTNFTYRTSYRAENGDQVDRGGVDGITTKEPLHIMLKPKQKRWIEINDSFIHSQALKGGLMLVACESR